jgi:dCMP deaminase
MQPDPKEPERKRIRKLIAHATIESMEGTCNRLQVGAVIARDGRVVASGYNGAPSHLPHCGPECSPGGPPCNRSVHAEANAIAFAARHGIATEGATMVSTDSPCLVCARLIINCGIKEIFYSREYRDTRPLEELQAAGIRTLLV